MALDFWGDSRLWSRVVGAGGVGQLSLGRRLSPKAFSRVRGSAMCGALWHSAPSSVRLASPWAERQLALIPGKGDLAKAFRYGLSRRAAFSLFLEDGRVAIDNNPAERTLRPIAVGWSLCTPFVSVWKHCDLVAEISATRASRSCKGGLDLIRIEVSCPYLVWCPIDHLICWQNTVLYQLADNVIGNCERVPRLLSTASPALMR